MAMQHAAAIMHQPKHTPAGPNTCFETCMVSAGRGYCACSMLCKLTVVGQKEESMSSAIEPHVLPCNVTDDLLPSAKDVMRLDGGRALTVICTATSTESTCCSSLLP